MCCPIDKNAFALSGRPLAPTYYPGRCPGLVAVGLSGRSLSAKCHTHTTTEGWRLMAFHDVRGTLSATLTPHGGLAADDLSRRSWHDKCYNYATTEGWRLMAFQGVHGTLSATLTPHGGLAADGLSRRSWHAKCYNYATTEGWRLMAFLCVRGTRIAALVRRKAMTSYSWRTTLVAPTLVNRFAENSWTSATPR